MAEQKVVDCYERARRALEGSPIQPLRNIQVDCSGDTMVLTGQLKSFYHKQLAQELVRTVAGEIELVNSINVSQDRV